MAKKTKIHYSYWPTEQITKSPISKKKTWKDNKINEFFSNIESAKGTVYKRTNKQNNIKKHGKHKKTYRKKVNPYQAIESIF